MKEKRLKLTDLLALIVFAVFALCVLLVLLSGAKVYRGLVQRGEQSFAARTTARYVTMRVRQAKTLTVEEFDGCEALTIPEEIDGETYLTRLYVYDGHIRELYCAENAGLSPADGEIILPADSLRFGLEDTLLTVFLDGQTLYLDLCGKEAAP